MLGYDKTNKYVILIFGVVMLFVLLFNFKIPKKPLVKIIPWIAVGLIPYAWYVVAANHSYMHVWFTYRGQLAAVISAIMIYFEFIDTNKIKKYLSLLIKWLKTKKSTFQSN